MDTIQIIDEIIRQQREHTERTLAEIITKYDFIVGSKECKYRLMKALPEGANIICSPHIESPTMIYAIKKFDIADLIEPYKTESDYNRDVNTGEIITLENIDRIPTIIEADKAESEDKA